MTSRPLLMIPGPIEITDAVREAYACPPPSHLSPSFIEAFSASLKGMRDVWRASADSQPFVCSGSGTLAMDMAVANLLDPGDQALQVDTGFFSQRMAQMLSRRGVHVETLSAPPGETTSADEVARALDLKRYTAVFATHVDTSTGVRTDARGIARAAKERGVLSVFDGVCATAGEPFEMENWGADVYLTASQKALGLPPGLSLLVASPAALGQRRRLKVPPMLSVDWLEWQPIMQAYEALKPSYFATPPTNMILALRASLGEMLPDISRRVAHHERVANAMRAAWSALGLTLLPTRLEHTANTLSAVYYPKGVNAALVGEALSRGVVIAGGLHPKLKDRYFRVGHMGAVTFRERDLERTLVAVGESLRALGHDADVEAAVSAADLSSLTSGRG